jgi:large subunit ribosomal protein L25
MDRPLIEAEKRQDLGSHGARRLRRQGLVPVVLYGHQLETVHLSVAEGAIESLVHEGARVVDLQVGETSETALLKDIQYDAMGDHVLHLDLARIDVDERVEVTVPVELHGTPRGVQEEGGVLDHVIQDIEIECPAVDIPESIRVEVGDLEIGDTVHIRDVTAPPGVTFLQDQDMVVASVLPPQIEPEIEEPEAVALETEFAAEPEVIGAAEREEEAEPEAAEEEE